MMNTPSGRLSRSKSMGNLSQVTHTPYKPMKDTRNFIFTVLNKVREKRKESNGGSWLETAQGVSFRSEKPIGSENKNNIIRCDEINGDKEDSTAADEDREDTEITNKDKKGVTSVDWRSKLEEDHEVLLDEFPNPPADDKTIESGLSIRLGISVSSVKKLLKEFPDLEITLLNQLLERIRDSSKDTFPSNLYKSVSCSDVSTSDWGNELTTDKENEDWDKETIKASKAT
ncbi:hypothetical protein PNOK_0546000 [Pyrrhoderma noxium]|uniref:Uncharacterized protein n=1 Tax=Pyrrhoderma noxium TaxID=2282107 RepID=A0A286UGB0_9AGAM|nr:hypothetical protein PNOK_0546000 [Pyrrhoderma noxium]